MTVVRPIEGMLDRPWGHVYVYSTVNADLDGLTRVSAIGASIDLSIQPAHPSLDTLVAHEVVHFSLGPTWRRLPPVLEEGLCEVIAQSANPQFASQRRAEHVMYLMSAVAIGVQMDVPMWKNGVLCFSSGFVSCKLDKSNLVLGDSALRLTPGALRAVKPDGNRRLLTSFGYLLASRIGIAELYLLCKEAEQLDQSTVSPERIFEAAHLDAKQRFGWRTAILEMLDDAGRRTLALQADTDPLQVDSWVTQSFDLQFYDSNGVATGSQVVRRAGDHGSVPENSISFTIAPKPLESSSTHP